MMKKLLTLAACAALLTGCDFVGGTGESVAISNLTLTTAPLPDDADGTGPDLYIEVQDAGGRAVIRSTQVFEDFDASAFPLVFATGGELLGAQRDYFVVVMDRTAEGYRFIAASEGFNPDELRAATTPVFEVSNGAGTVRAELSLAP